ncbi:MAG: class I SAM-dependent RNA methyltransferase [Oscillospiraceae bacterium]|nr:class I SAM-dependent RNA methyltransferase [Oscillospiraceae bacterium]
MQAAFSDAVHNVTITGYGSGGEGVARLCDGKVVFVRSAARGDVLEVKLTKEKPRSAYGEVCRILTASPHRIEPDCPYYPGCGGCDFRHITYVEELDAKLRRINDALGRIGGLAAHVDGILSTGRPDGYRNKAVLHSDGESLGFYGAGSHMVIPIKRCALLKDDLNEVLERMASASGRGISGGNLGANLGIAHELRSGKGEVMLRSGRNGISPPLEEELDGLVFGISGFFQVNTEAASLLYRKAREYAEMSPSETLLDLYCGVGSLTIFVGRDAGRALGVEINPDAIEAARKNARRNGFSHIDFIAADAAQWSDEAVKPDCIIVDPPRSGLSRDALRKILGLSPKRIVYVSCDPATLARDIRMLDGYSLIKACAVDMFPRTANVECCCLLNKR